MLGGSGGRVKPITWAIYMSRRNGYARAQINNLRAVIQTTPMNEWQLKNMYDVIDFLETSLSEAAKEGCHHCGERTVGTPCWWCGLLNENGG